MKKSLLFALGLLTSVVASAATSITLDGNSAYKVNSVIKITTKETANGTINLGSNALTLKDGKAFYVVGNGNLAASGFTLSTMADVTIAKVEVYDNPYDNTQNAVIRENVNLDDFWGATDYSSFDFTFNQTVQAGDLLVLEVPDKDLSTTVRFTQVWDDLEMNLNNGVLRHVLTESDAEHLNGGDLELYAEDDIENMFRLAVYSSYANGPATAVTYEAPAEPTSIELTIGEAGYATFGNYTADNLQLPEGLTAYAAYYDESRELVILKPVNVVAPNMGVIVKGETSTYTFEPTEEACDYEGENQLVAVTEELPYQNYSSDGNFNFIFAKKDGQLGFYLSSGNGTMAKGKAYLAVPASALGREVSPSRGIKFCFDDETTGVALHATANDTAKTYDLLGRRNKGSRLSIVGGKKYIVK